MIDRNENYYWHLGSERVKQYLFVLVCSEVVYIVFFVHSEPYRAHAGWHSTRGWLSSFRRQFHLWICNSGRKTFTSVFENNINLFFLLKHLSGSASYSCKSSNVISWTLLNSLDFYNTDQNFFCLTFIWYWYL